MSDFLGKTIGEYQLVEVLDESGEAMVFKGFQPGMNRYVGVKMLKPSAARDAGVVQQFLQQGELMARMQHPNILAVFSSGQEGGVVYRAERLAESSALRDHLNWFFDLNQALKLVEGIVSGLEYIHAQGYVHGNLKPSNILLDASQKPLLADFGTPARLTQPLSPYLAPEQIQGGVVDARADVYALGVLLFEILTGQAPPPGVVVSPRSRRPDMPEALERVIFKAMAQNPDQRYQSIREFRDAMRSAIQAPVPVQTPVYQPPQPAPAPPPSVSQSVTVEGQKGGTNWLAIVLGIIVVGVLCVGGFFGVRYLLGGQETETVGPPPTQPPPGITVIVPTVVLPTQEQPATQPPPEPTQPPPEPTQPPEQPTDEPPQDELPAQLPEEPPAEPGEPPGGGLPEVCGSVGFIAVGIGLVSAGRGRQRRSGRRRG